MAAAKGKILTLLAAVFLFAISTCINMHFVAVQSSEKSSMHRLLNPRIIAKEHHTDGTNEVYCESTSLGCFKMQKTVNNQVQVATFRFMTPAWCVTYCQSNEQTYAVIKGDRCMCSKNLHDICVVEKPSDSCTNRCEGDGSFKCGGNGSAVAYFIRGTCVKAPFNEEFAESRYKGCFALPKTQRSMTRFGDFPNISKCLLLCEVGRHPLAAVDGSGGCWCGRMTSSFNLTHRIDSQHCNNQSDQVRVFRTMADDERCSKIRLLPPGKHKRTLLASFPGSGNTWTRFLLERATGYYTGSVYNDLTLTEIGFLGENYKVESGFTDLIKDHSFSGKKKIFPHLEAALLVIRNPYRAFLAFGNYLHGGHVGTATEDDLIQVITPKFEKWVSNWKGLLSRILKANMTLKVMYFEDMVADPIASVRDMVDFLPNPLLHPRNLEERLACLSQDTTGLAKRKSHQLTVNPFPMEWRKAINDSILEMREALKKAGVKKELPPYENDPFFM